MASITSRKQLRLGHYSTPTLSVAGATSKLTSVTHMNATVISHYLTGSSIIQKTIKRKLANKLQKTQKDRRHSFLLSGNIMDRSRNLSSEICRHNRKLQLGLSYTCLFQRKRTKCNRRNAERFKLLTIRSVPSEKASINSP
uniref:Uncharacterized protein n=1 Tax=Romanomermis culicivorax TaxID=13658 RepID=A0A915J2J0_ROMCU